MPGSDAGRGSRQNASTERPSGPGQLTAVERSVGMSAPSWLIKTACLNPMWYSQPGNWGWNALDLAGVNGRLDAEECLRGQPGGVQVPPLRFGREERILAIAVRTTAEIDRGGEIGEEPRLQLRESLRSLRARALECLARRRHADRQPAVERLRPRGVESTGVELHEIDPVHTLRVDLFAGLEEFLRRGREVSPVFGVVARRGLDGRGDVAPEGGCIEEANVVRGLVEVIEHEVAEPQPAERRTTSAGASRSGIGSPNS